MPAHDDPADVGTDVATTDEPGTAASVEPADRRLSARRRWLPADRSERSVRFARLSVPATAAMALWKGGLMILSPSVFLLANVLFSFGVVAAKLVAVRAHGRLGEGTARVQSGMRAYLRVGQIVLGLSLAYVAMCAVVALGGARTDRYDGNIAISIATVAFIELGFAIHGIVVARRDRDLVVEAIKLVNLAGALVLLVLTQAALLSVSGTADPSRVCGLTGVLLGSIAVGTGVRMLRRHRAR